MAIEKKLIHFGKLADFEAQLTAGNILDYSIVFIQDAKKIWTHGTYYDCSEGTEVPDSVYVTDFTVNDLLNLVETPDSVLSADFQSMCDAMVAHKVVLVPYDTREGFAGYGIANGYREDMFYFSVKIEGGRCIEVEVNDYSQLQSDDVYIATYVGKERLRTINGQTLLGDGDITVGGEDNVQSDWNVTDTSSDAFIKNKPTIPTKVSQLDNDAEYITHEDVAHVAVSGSYNDLQDTPTIPTRTSQLTNDNGLVDKVTLNTALEDYVIKERVGELDVANAQGLYGGGYVYALPDQANGDEGDVLLSRNSVKTINGESILGSGDIAIQGGSGTITEVKANGTSVATSGVANIPAASTSAYGVTKLSSATNSTSTTLAATASAVKAAYDLANGRQPKLVSGTNIKTINGESILGTGDITIKERELEKYATDKSWSIIASNLLELLIEYGNAPDGTKAIVVADANSLYGVNLFDALMGNVDGVVDAFTNPDAFTLEISAIDTSVELPVSITSDVRVEVPFNDKIYIDMGADMASIYHISVQAGFTESVWGEGHWHGTSSMIGNKTPLSRFSNLDDNAFAGLMAIAPALIVDFVGTKTITEFVKNGDNWEVWSEGESGLNTKLNAWLEQIAQLLPTKTSQLENDSNFITSDGLKTINGESILGSGDIEVSGGGSKTYVFDWGSGTVYSGTISAEEFAEMIAADTIIVKGVGGMMREADSVTKEGTSVCSFIIHTYISNWINGVYFVFENNGSSGVSWTATQSVSTIPTKTSELTNDSNFVSSTNLKTINGESILGSGDITISGGNGSTNGIAMKVEYITPTHSSIAFMGTEQRPSMKANTIYIQQAGSSHAETLDGLDIESFEETTEAYAEYVIIFVFNSPLFGATISLPSYVKWTNGTPPAVEAEVVYELNISRSILAGEATYCAVLTPFKHVE